MDSLADIDIKRFHNMEAEGGELMRVMRDTTLDNGMNALKMYENLLRTVQVQKKVNVVEASETSILDVQNDTKPAVTAPPTKKRGRGRPKKNK
ncbi:MAG: hypothetical protein KJO69_05735 [Gammaproteobacteria bacterium]|nr:hypothetical protein [Gammaproteobacteria bacterium]